MVGTRKQLALVAAVCTALSLSGCDKHNDPGPLNAMVSPAMPATAQEIANPLRGQYEDLLVPLFPQGNPAQQAYPAWPASYDASFAVSWRQLQPADPGTLPPDAPDDRKFDFSAIDDALTKLASRNMRLILRVYAYNSCCDISSSDNTNIAIPDWVRPASTAYPGPPNGGGVTQVVPNWNDPKYLDAFGQLLAALGRRYDGDERLSVFEFSGYGDFSKNPVASLRDKVGVPGPAAVRQLVAANVNAFPRTQMITTTLNPEIVRQMLSDETTKKSAAPACMACTTVSMPPVAVTTITGWVKPRARMSARVSWPE